MGKGDKSTLLFPSLVIQNVREIVYMCVWVYV